MALTAHTHHHQQFCPVQQEEILHNGLSRNLSLQECMDEFGMSLNDLRYVAHDHPAMDCGKNNIMPKHTKKDTHMLGKGLRKIPVVSFFAGAGGMDIGLEQAGFDHLALFEHNEIFCRTIKANRPYWHVIGPPADTGDVSNVEETIAILREKFSMRPGFPGVFAGGPPCQPFSVAANQRFQKGNAKFKRVGYSNAAQGLLLFDFGKIIQYFKPRVFIVENVCGLSDVDDGKHLSVFCKEMAEVGYQISSPRTLRAENFGVPQYRKRLFVVGSLSGKWTPPVPWSHAVSSGDVLTDDVVYHSNHQIRQHKIESVLRYRELNFGQRDHLGRVDRLNPMLPSKTVIAGGLKGGGRSHLHPWVPRTLSVRESARLQTFPDNYIFEGPIARQFTQVGNAVPPLLAKQLGESILSSFYG